MSSTSAWENDIPEGGHRWPAGLLDASAILGPRLANYEES
jgi:hypothetical protein